MQHAGTVRYLDDDTDGQESYRLRSGEVVAVPAGLVRLFEVVDATRARERLDYCQRNDLDPDTWSGCYACEGTGKHMQTNDPCWCAYGAKVQRDIEQQAEREFQERMQRLRDQGATK